MILDMSELNCGLLSIRVFQNDKADAALDFGEHLKKRWPDLRILILTGKPGDTFVKEM